MVTNLAHSSAIALQQMAAEEYAFARAVTTLARDSVRYAESARRYQSLARTVADEARAARDRYLAQTAD